jgi:cysteine desulfurase family protein (TIGR01976 family)
MSIATETLDVEAVRQQFPALSLRIDGQPAVFLDNPAGTQVPQVVIDRLTEYWRTMNANHGGVFATSQRSDAQLDQTRAMAAAFFNAESPEEVVFGANMTTLTFAVSRAIGREFRPGDEIVVSRLEHDANVSPWLALQEQGITVRVADITLPACTLDVDSLKEQLTPRTRLVALTHASNAVGTIPPMRQVADLAHAAGAWFWVDAVHYAPHGVLDVRAIDCDFLVSSAYKFYGPHLGLLYGRRELLERLRPFKVRPAPAEVPGRWETGTQNLEGLAGLLGAFEYLAGLAPDSPGSPQQRLVAAMQRIAIHERALVARLLDGLRRIRGLQIYGITEPERLEERVPTVSLAWPPHQPESLARWLAQHQVFTWHGDHYAPGLIERLGLQDSGGTLRIGLAHYNRPSEVDLVLELLDGFRG